MKSSTRPESVVVVPCYNEGHRLQLDGFDAFRAYPQTRLLFVNDGSTDNTQSLLEQICARLAGRAEILVQPKNGGKAEAVRAGLLAATSSGASIVGYLDADLATPPVEMARLLEVMIQRNAAVVMGARVGLLGTSIERRAMRHYMGRAFATFASLVLSLRVYDTQCGAKVFRCSPLLEASLWSPFSSRWAFDVELIGRLLIGAPGHAGLTRDAFVEVPLAEWRDIAGSKLKVTDIPKMALDLLRIKARLRKRQRALAAGDAFAGLDARADVSESRSHAA